MTDGPRPSSFTSSVVALGGDREGADAVAADLLAAWSEEHRRYHDVRHLAEVLAAVERLLPDGHERALATQAAWWHDAVYDVADPAGNEAASAAWARRALTGLDVSAEHVAAVAGLVEDTVAHELTDPSGLRAAFHDADLWILAAPEERFEEYCRQVREEYAAVADDDYARGRTAVLRPFLERPRLYATDAAQPWTPAARGNLRRELARLAP